MDFKLRIKDIEVLAVILTAGKLDFENDHASLKVVYAKASSQITIILMPKYGLLNKVLLGRLGATTWT